MNALEISCLTKVYKNNLHAVKSIDLQVKQGDFFALLGPNGAGKSTTIGIITGLVNKTSGHVRVFDYDLDTQAEDLKAQIGLVPQEINFNQFEKVLDIVVNQAGYYGIENSLALVRAEIYLKQLGLWEKRNTQSRTLSGGMKRRLMIARALLHEPRLLILDEPTAGVDIELRRSTWEFLKTINANGTTIILTTHYLEEAESMCQNIAIIDHGLIVENTTMKALLAKLNSEVFIFDIQEHLYEPPKLMGFTSQLLDETRLEVEVTREQSLNELFKRMNECGLTVLSMRNKTNRLEELFIRLVKKQAPAQTIGGVA